ncbi:MAG: RNA polymerase sigma factor RpoD/SigA, partial [Candidatus Latescibacteria bacterium]|nr:RNA polymerase sigma factor RpoD/SigA [Candidatus Latescibacterota bacterium]
PFEEQKAVERYLHEIAAFPILSSPEEAVLARRIRAGDQAALNRLVQSNLRFVVTIAREYQHKGIPLLDLIDEGNVGLIIAAQRFDEARGFRFISYAVWWIRQAIRQAFADQVRLVRLPRLQVETLARLEEMIRSREQVTARPVSLDAIAEDAGVFRTRAGWLLTTASRPYSLDEQFEEDADLSLIDLLPDTQQLPPDEAVMEQTLKETVHHAIQTLPEREADVLCQYFGLLDDEPHTLDEIGQQLGMSRERVRQIKDRGLQRLRHASRSLRLHACL